MMIARCTWDEVTGVDGYNVYLKSNGEFVKQNTELITDTTYDIPDIEVGEFEAYSTSVRGSEESAPSNIEPFIVEPPEPEGFYTDFSDQQTGQIPQGWTVTAGSTGVWTVSSKGDATGGKALRAGSSSATSGQHFLRWDIPILGDMLVEGKFMATFEHSANRLRLLGRAGDNETAYFSELTGHSNRFAIWKVLDGDFTLFDNDPIPWSVNVWYRQEIEIIGTQIRNRFWVDGESKPDWILSAVDSDISEGRAGVSMRISGAISYSWLDWIRVTPL